MQNMSMHHSIITWQYCMFEPFFHCLLHCSEFFMPGMVDTHIHASQYSYAGTALDMPLLQWLNTYTFPVESRFKDLEFARRVYSKVVVSLAVSWNNRHSECVQLLRIRIKKDMSFVASINGLMCVWCCWWALKLARGPAVKVESAVSSPLLSRSL